MSSARLLTGKEPAEALLASIAADVKKLDPLLVIVQVGDDAASTSYITKKLESAKAIGMRCTHRHLPEGTTEKELFDLVEELNTDSDVTGYIVQLPLPGVLKKITPQLFKAIDPKKDVDGFTAYNLGKMLISPEFEHLPPATPAGVIRLLEYYNISVEGKHAVVVGQSNIVGKPLAVMLANRGATVTVCHDKTVDVPSYTKQADLLFSAVGKPRLITADMVKPGAVVIDIGTTREGNSLVGDTTFEELLPVASAITPVPGGVGPMTVASLLANCVTAKKRQMEK